MTGGCRKVPSKTFHFAPISEDDLGDLFEHHLAVSSLLQACTSILEEEPFIAAMAKRALEAADLSWVRVLRRPRGDADNKN